MWHAALVPCGMQMGKGFWGLQLVERRSSIKSLDRIANPAQIQKNSPGLCMKGKVFPAPILCGNPLALSTWLSLCPMAKRSDFRAYKFGVSRVPEWGADAWRGESPRGFSQYMSALTGPRPF